MCTANQNERKKNPAVYILTAVVVASWLSFLLFRCIREFAVPRLERAVEHSDLPWYKGNKDINAKYKALISFEGDRVFRVNITDGRNRITITSRNAEGGSANPSANLSFGECASEVADEQDSC